MGERQAAVRARPEREQLSATVAESSTPSPMIGLDGVTVRFDGTTAVRDVRAAVGRGEWVALIGANGAGKTTLLRAIAQLQRHDGAIQVAGRALGDLPSRQRARLVAYVPQKPHLPADMTVIDYTLLGRTPHIGYFGAESAGDRRHCAALLERLDLAAMAGRILDTLSGGELQRVVLARALAQDAPVLLLDEPTSALDLSRRVDTLELVDELRRGWGLTVVSALHDLTLAAQFADRLMLMSEGSIVTSGAPSAVLREDLLSAHFGGRVRVIVTAEGELIVVPRRTAHPGRRGDRWQTMDGQDPPGD